MSECPNKQETKVDLALELAKQTYRFGPVLNLQATWAASLALPWGLAAAGAAATRTFVDAGDVKGTARSTALMVKIGMLNLVRDIVANLSQQGRADVVAQVTMALLELQEFLVVSQINNALISAGYLKESADVAGVMGSKMSSNFFTSLKEAGANLLPDIWPNHTSPASSTTGSNAEAESGDVRVI
ncbi:g3099 [Coccomyxa elongata]